MSTAIRPTLSGDESMIRELKKSSRKSAAAKTRPNQTIGVRTEAVVEAQAAAVQTLAAAMLQNATILALGASKALPLASGERAPGVLLAGPSKDSTAAFIAAVAKHRDADREVALQRA